ncbi:hypothetical protein LINGRAHAP2_LOCUS7506, partial [Linum grandiflorum]
MVENNGCWEYVGGVRAVVDFQKDKVGYFLLRRDVLGMEEARKAGLVTIYFDGEPLVENVSDNEE